MIGYISSAHFIDHDTSRHHPERPDRIRAIARAVRESGWVTSPDPFPGFQIELGSMTPAPQPLIELPEPHMAEEDRIRLVHPQAYIDGIKHVCDIGGGVLDQGDTAVSEHSFDIARLSLGALLEACDAVVAGKVQRVFAAIRPPGHHAEPDRSLGFCLFSNIAIAARHLQQRHGLGKLAIVDFDVHHGNGTQAVFEADPSVLFVSLHQDPRTCYPGSGYSWETGIGNILNLPMEPGSEDVQYLEAFRDQVLPAIDRHKPEMILISAGFDAHREDPLADINLSEDCFEEMTRQLVQSANVHCGGRVISGLEGGYNLRAMGRSVVRHLAGLNTR